jgi:DNA-binding NtrC family response regulator
MENSSVKKIFVVDDDPFSLHLYQQHLINLGYTDIRVFDNGTGCLNSLDEQPDVIFLDHGMEVLNGVEVLKKIKRFDPQIHVVFISGQEEVATAVNSLKYGAFDYIEKGKNDMDRITIVLEKINEVNAMLKRSRKGLLARIFSIV